MDLFTHLHNLTVTKAPYVVGDVECEKTYVPFMINRFVSMCDMFVSVANEMNKATVGTTIPPETHYLYYQVSLPQRHQYFAYLKKSTGSKQTLHEEEAVMWFFKVGRRDAQGRMKVLQPAQTQQIVEMYDEYARTGNVS